MSVAAFGTALAVGCSDYGNDDPATDTGTGTGTGTDTGTDTGTGTGTGTGTDTGTGTETDACNGPDSISSVCDTTALSALTAEESAQLCSDIWAYYAANIDAGIICKFLALSDGLSLSAHDDAQLQTGCNAAETSCLADPSTAWPTDLGLYCGSIPADCGATVAEYSQCIKDIAANTNAQVPGMPTCTEITLARNQEIWDFVTADRLPSCTATCSLWPPDPRDL